MKNIAILRKRKGLTQGQLAKMIGYSTSTVAMWETGRRKPDYTAIAKMCDFFGVSFEELIGSAPIFSLPAENKEIPIVGYVRAGYPNTAEECILGYENINENLARTGDFFALKIKGNSMEPKMSDGDTVIIRRQSTAHNGQIALVLVGKEEATVKKVFFDRDGITLIPTNTEYFPIHYTAMECRNLPVTIAGVVVELRCKFE